MKSSSIFTNISFATVILMAALPLSAVATENCQPPKTSATNVSCTNIEGLYMATDQQQNTIFINQRAKTIANLKGYDWVDGQFGSGVTAVGKNEKIGYINSQGKLVIPIMYDSLYDPNDKYNETSAYVASDNRITVLKNGKWGVIDTSNKTIVPFNNNYQRINAFSEGRAAVQNRSNKWGIIDTTGKEVVKPQYDDIDGHWGGYYGFSEGLLGVSKNDKWGYITKTGVVAIPFIYDEIRPFSEQLAGVRKGNKWGFINGANKTVIPFQYDDDKLLKLSANYMGQFNFIFYDGQAEFDLESGYNVCINKKGQQVQCR